MSIELRVDSAVGHASMPLKESAIGILSNAIAKYVRLLGIYVRKMHSVHRFIVGRGNLVRVRKTRLYFHPCSVFHIVPLLVVIIFLI